MNISLPQAQHEFIESRVTSGEFGSASEYMQDLIQRDQELRMQEDLAKKLREGLESGPATEMTREDWKRLRERLVERARKGRAG